MRNLLLFHGSCGHTIVEEIYDDAEWQQFSDNVANRTRIGRETRTVYVRPVEHEECRDCARETYLKQKYLELEAILHRYELADPPEYIIIKLIAHEMDRIFWRLLTKD